MINKLGTPIIQQDKKGNNIKEYPSQSEAFRQTGIRQTDISACCVGKQKTAAPEIITNNHYQSPIKYGQPLTTEKTTYMLIRMTTRTRTTRTRT